eukprot:Tamp_05370.p2 GENE.Tamp_05370~~Tamp_05370.p2  ORF type:complete len:237 (-),score=55.25 Tamp_05370:1135-1845(-)
MGMHRLGRYAYSLVDAAAANKTFLVWMKLKEGYDPNGNYVGVTAMQVAIENQNEEMFLVLLKFGASPERPTASKARGVRYDSGETPRQMLARCIKENEKIPEKHAMFTRMLSYVESPEKLQTAADELIPRLKQLEEEERNAGLSLAGQMLSVVGLIALTIVFLHVQLIMLPDIAAAWMPETLTAHMCLFSPALMGHSLMKPFPSPDPGVYGYCVVQPDGRITPLIDSTVPPVKNEL